MTLIETKSKKVEFGLKAYFKPTPTNLQKWMLALKGLIALLAANEALSSRPYFALAALIAGYVLDELAKMFSETPKE